jgi:glycosyltransferase involved in cell wall biosynthesis
MKVLALASYPVEAAATRYRLQQFVAPLAERGVTLEIHPFLNSHQFKILYRRNALPATAVGLLKSAVMRVADLVVARKADVILIQRESMLFGPPIFERLIARGMKRPMVLDLDDATYVAYHSPTYGALGKLKWFSKTDDLIRWARLVTCGNRSIAEYVTSKGAQARVIPTVVDTKVFHPVSRESNERPVKLGWIGTHSTFPYLESIFPVLSQLAEDREFSLKIVGAGRSDITVPNVQVETLPWELDREVRDFQSIDIGLYPIDASLYSGNWAQGKSGFKAVQYMAVGVPYVATPVGGSAEIGEAGKTHLFASTNDEWYRNLKLLISDARLREEMGAAGRQHAIEHYGLEDQAEKLVAALREAARK